MTEERQHAQVRAVAVPLLQRPVERLALVAGNWLVEIDSRGAVV